MNISNEETFTVVASLFDALVKAVAKEIAENYNKPEDDLFTDDRIIKLMVESSIIDDKVQYLFENSDVMSQQAVSDMIADKLESYDPSDSHEFDNAVDLRIESYMGENPVESEMIREVVRDMHFSVEVR